MEGKVVEVFGKDRTGGMNKNGMGESRRWKKRWLGFFECTEWEEGWTTKVRNGRKSGRRNC